MSEKVIYWIVGVVVSLLLLSGIVFLSSFQYVNNYEIGYIFNKRTGEISKLEWDDGTPKIGYVFKKPLLESIYVVDTRPVQICISANSRVLNCRLVAFDTAGYYKFISWHGIDNYIHDGMGGVKFKDILMSYAFDPNLTNSDYDFLKILKSGDLNSNNKKVGDELE